ncbi:MAG: hypothetical protein ACPGU4_03865 [Flavobacteriales bacterium]
MNNLKLSLSLAVVLLGLTGLSGCFLNGNEEDLCTNTCQYAYDGECDDGGPGSITSLCPCATDCADCGERSELECDGGSSSSSSGSSSSSSSGGGYNQSEAIGTWFGEAPNSNHWYLYLCGNGLFTFKEYNPVGDLQFNHAGTWSVSGSNLYLSGSNNWTFAIIEITTAGAGGMIISSSGTQVLFENQLDQDPCATTGSSSSSSSGGSSSGSSGGSSSSSSGGSGIYNAVLTTSMPQGADCGLAFGCTGMLSVEVRVASNNQLVASGIIDPCGATYQGINSSNPPSCYSPNTLFVPNLQEGVLYKWTSSCPTYSSSDDDSGFFDEGPGGSQTVDGCRRVGIH